MKKQSTNSTFASSQNIFVSHFFTKDKMQKTNQPNHPSSHDFHVPTASARYPTPSPRHPIDAPQPPARPHRPITTNQCIAALLRPL
jgi:hypothetical protein